MTKYILHGGNTREPNEDNDSFFREWTVGLTGKVHILLCYFACEKEKIEQYFKEETERVVGLSENKDLEFEIADENKLADQLKNAEVFYMRGGSTEKILSELSKTPNLDKLVEGKTIAGSSAGAYAIAKYALSNESGEFRDGLGLLNVKCYCHFKDGEEKNLKRLIEYKEDLPIITLPDYKWVTIYK